MALNKNVHLRRVSQRYGERGDGTRYFYQQRSYGGGGEGQSAEGQAVGLTGKKLSEKLSTGGFARARTNKILLFQKYFVSLQFENRNMATA